MSAVAFSLRYTLTMFSIILILLFLYREWILVYPPRLPVHPLRLLVHPPPIGPNEMNVQGRFSLKITPERRNPEMTP